MKYVALALALLSPPADAAMPISMTIQSRDYNKPAFGYTTCYYKQSYPYSAQPLRVRHEVSIFVQRIVPVFVEYEDLALDCHDELNRLIGLIHTPDEHERGSRARRERHYSSGQRIDKRWIEEPQTAASIC